MKTLAVSELNAQIKSILETTFMDICVQGEISSVKVHTSGHIYLSLKDEDSVVRCVMFKGNARNLKIELEVGQNVQVHGAISVYVPKGEYQIFCKSINLAGMGELAKAYEALKIKLYAKGYFDDSHKKIIPRFPKRIALLTSSSGAAKEDMLKIAHKRWENIHITLFNTIVQGNEAKDSIVKNIQRADSFFGTSQGFDVIVIGRGGGSMEDMWAFNEECVAQAIFEAKTPIVSAVGHEVDVFISDFVADMRAPTPSAAMEMLLPDKNEWFRAIDEMINTLSQAFEHTIAYKGEILGQMKQYFSLYNFQSQYKNKKEQIDSIRALISQHFHTLLNYKLAQAQDMMLPLVYAFDQKMKQCSHTYERIFESLQAYSPNLLCARGYAQVSKANKPMSLENLRVGDKFSLYDVSYHVLAQCLEIHNNTKVKDEKI